MPRGRNQELLSLRDEKLLRRYYELTEVQNLRFDRALQLLSEDEFFISEARIMAIIRSNCNRLADMQVKPVPKVRMPRLNARQLKILFDNKEQSDNGIEATSC